MLLYIVLFLVIAIAAVPYGTIQAIVNLVITGLNWLIGLLLGVVNVIGQLIIQIAYAIMNWVAGGIIGLVNLVIATGPWEPIAVPLIRFVFEIPTLNFSSMGINIAYSPIGSLLQFLFSDPLIANFVGAVALIAIAVLAIAAYLKTR